MGKGKSLFNWLSKINAKYLEICAITLISNPHFLFNVFSCEMIFNEYQYIMLIAFVIYCFNKI